jgi:hypothetical protein
MDFGGGRGGAREHAFEGVVAGAALVADAAALEVAERRGSRLDGVLDVPFRFTAADADDHAVRSLSFLRLSLSTRMMPRSFPFRQWGPITGPRDGGHLEKWNLDCSSNET